MEIKLTELTATPAELIAAGVHVNKYADPVEDAREDLTIEDAEEVASEDLGLLWVDSEDLNRLSFQSAQELADSGFEVALSEVEFEEWDCAPEVLTALQFGGHTQLWGDSGLFWEGDFDSLRLAKYIVEPGMLGSDDISEEQFESFCERLQELAPGVDIVPSFSTSGASSPELAVDVMRDSAAWEQALNETFANA